MYQQQTGDVVLHYGPQGLVFAIAHKPTLTFGNERTPNKLPARLLISVLISIGLWSMPFVSQAAVITAEQLIEQTNVIRIERGLPALTENSSLQQAAQAKANDMLNRQYFDHTSPTGKSPWSFITTSGYRFTSAGENLALEPSSTDDPTADWMASPGHRQNILDPKYTDIGIAFASGQFEGASTTLIVQFFGNRRSPTITDTPATPVIHTSTSIPPKQPIKVTSTSSIPVRSAEPPSTDQVTELVPAIEKTSTPPSTVLGVSTRVIPSRQLPIAQLPAYDPAIAMVIFRVIVLYFLMICLCVLFGLAQVRTSEKVLIPIV